MDKPRSASDSRPPSTVSQSFKRLDSIPQTPTHRSRASTTGGLPPEILFPQNVSLSPESEEKAGKGDIFSTRDDEDSDGSAHDEETSEVVLAITFEELPIEIRSMTERYELA